MPPEDLADVSGEIPGGVRGIPLWLEFHPLVVLLPTLTMAKTVEGLVFTISLLLVGLAERESYSQIFGLTAFRAKLPGRVHLNRCSKRNVHTIPIGSSDLLEEA